ncbi:MAG: hypothetical protein GWO24_23850 [Akkermansiaceae bacterium]|nr:hypothetical protein [Akkermansiaceae bacterium]
MVDLFDTVGFARPVEPGRPSPDFENGMHLNERGYRRLASFLADKLGVRGTNTELAVRSGERRVRMTGGRMDAVEPIKRGVRFDFAADQLPMRPVEGLSPDAASEVRIRIDGEEVSFDPERKVFHSGADFEQAEKLRRVILEKNKFHRYKLNPINKAYIFLFRRHEMGHLAYPTRWKTSTNWWRAGSR